MHFCCAWQDVHTNRPALFNTLLPSLAYGRGWSLCHGPPLRPGVLKLGYAREISGVHEQLHFSGTMTIFRSGDLNVYVTSKKKVEAY